MPKKDEKITPKVESKLEPKPKSKMELRVDTLEIELEKLKGDFSRLVKSHGFVF